MNRAVSTGLLAMLLFAGLVQAGLLLETAHADEEPDPYDGDPDEWEKQVAQDARGDVQVEWPGSIDLLYMTMGNLHSLGRDETFLLVRIGYNITAPDEATVQLPDESPQDPIPAPPQTVDQAPVAMINLTFNITRDGADERTQRITFITADYGESWATDQGFLVSDNPREDREDKELIYAAPLRRFDLEEDDVLSGYNVSSYRNERLVDTLHGFDPANDYLPAYVPLHPLLSDPTRLVYPLLPPGVPRPDLPDPYDPPEPVPAPPEDVPRPTDVVPDEPYPEPPGSGDQGLPKGSPHPDDLEDWDPDHDGPTPWDPEALIAGLTDPESGAAWSSDFTIETGRSRFVARSHQEVIHAGINEVGFGNFTIDNLMTETEQTVGLFWSGPPNMGWLMRYGLDMPTGIKTLPADGSVEMSLIVAPESLFARPTWAGAAVFISDWGGIEVVPVLLESTTQGMKDPRRHADQGLILPENPEITILNADSTFQVNQRRNLIIQVRDKDTGQYVSGLSGVRAFIYPEGAVPNNLPYQLREKPWMDGVYEVAFVFDRPGAWHVQVYLFDYPPDADGEGWPHDTFTVRVDYASQTPPLMPLSLALLSVGLIVTAVWARERIGKSR